MGIASSPKKQANDHMSAPGGVHEAFVAQKNET
jgi:hypothetical protein